jgi:hypothetical protein
MKITKRQLRRIIGETLEEAGMPSSVIKSKQRLAQMTDEEFTDSHGDKSEEKLRQMAWTHGYGKMSPHYWNRVKRAKEKAPETKRQDEMKITKRQLRRIIKEAKVALLKEQYDRDTNAGYDYDPDSDPAQRAQADMEQMQYEEYKTWAKETGQITPAASSVMATYFVEQELTDDKAQIDMMAAGYGIDTQDVMRDIKRQQAEYEVGGALSNEEDFERGFKEGASLENMPDSWRQILGNCLGADK